VALLLRLAINLQLRSPHFTPPRAPLPSGPSWAWWMPLSLIPRGLPVGDQIFDLPPTGYRQPVQIWTRNFPLNLIGKDAMLIGDQIFDLPPRGYLEPGTRTWISLNNLALTATPPPPLIELMGQIVL